MEIKDGKIEVANPYKDPDGNAISFENARVTQSFNENIALEYDKKTNIITVTGANRGRIEIMTEYDIPLHKGDKKVGELYITIYADNEAHQHTFGSWESDDENHWKECDCGARSEEASHTFEWIVDREATETQAGLKHEECKVCSYRRAAVEIPAIQKPETEKPENTEKQPAAPQNAVSKDTAPQTGDPGDVFFWGLLCAAAVSGAGMTLFARKKSDKYYD